MLNLSDNELDRLSREAANEHDPGDLTGPQSWERLELRLDKELGRAGPDVSRGLGRGFRRLPFQYAPVLLLVVGVTYYFVKAKGRKPETSGSPPLTVVKTPQQQQAGTDSISSPKNSVYSDKSTSTLYPAGPENPSAGPNSTSPAGSTSPARDHAAAPGSDRTAVGPDKTASGPDRTASGPDHAASGPDKTSSGLNNNTSGTNHNTSGKGSISAGSGVHHQATGDGMAHQQTAGNGIAGHQTSGHQTRGHQTTGHQTPGSQTADDQTALLDQDHTGRLTQPPASGKSSDPEHVFIQHPFSLRSRPGTNALTLRADSALRAYAANARKDQSNKPGPAMRINRALGIGILFAPDFTSVNALAGDHPGSTFGITVDYEVLNNLHLGTGLLFSRKNYTARGLDYHAPPDYFRQNGMKPADFVKGTMNMLEIPINLRYDFSEAGGTRFFANVGVSSYLFGQENCNYYYDFFGSQACRDFHYSNTPNALFASLNLSLGVEAKIGNGVYALIAPYMKLPTSDIGFGKVRMNSVGINFAIRFTPVIGRSRPKY